MQQLNQNNSGSLPSIPKMDYHLDVNDQFTAVLLKEVQTLKNKVIELETKKIMEETQLPREVLEDNHMFPEVGRRTKRGRGYRPLLKSEMEEVIKQSVTMAQAARKLRVHVRTFRKYAKMYGIWAPKPRLKGERQVHNPEIGKYPLSKILSGEFNGNKYLNDWKVKDKLIRSGTKSQACEKCGLSEKRTGDNKVPLLLHHIDGDLTNWKLENLQFLCLNCTFYIRGYVRRGRFVLNPDWSMGMDPYEYDKPPRY